MTIIIFILLNLAILFSSHLIAYRYFRDAHFSEQLVTTFLLYISQVTFTVLFLGVVIRSLDLLLITILNTVISGSIIVLFGKSVKESLFQSYEKIQELFSHVRHSGDFVLYSLLVLFTLQVLSLLIKIYYLPSHVWDVLAYHLYPVVEWFQQGKIPSFIETAAPHINNVPLGAKPVIFWFTAFPGSLTWVELPQFISGLIVGLTGYSLMQKLNIKKNEALKYALLIYFIPSILIESRTAQDHLVLTAVTIIAVLYFVDVFYEGNSSRIPFLSLSLGLLLGIKISSPSIIFVLFAALLVSKGFNARKIAAFFHENKFPIISGLFMITAIGGYWYVRSGEPLKRYSFLLHRTIESPFFWGLVFLLALLVFSRKYITRIPKKVKKTTTIAVFAVLLTVGIAGIIKNMNVLRPFLFGYKCPSSILADKTFNAQNPSFNNQFMKNVLSFPFRIKDIGEHNTYSPSFWRMSGFGIQFFAFGLVAYLVTTFFVVTQKQYRNHAVGFIFIFSTVLLASYFLFYYSRANYRLFMFFPVFGIVLWSFVAGKMNFQPFYLKFIHLFILVMVLFNMVTSLYEGNVSGSSWKTLFTIQYPLERTPTRFSHFLSEDEWQYLDIFTEPDEPVGYFGKHNLLIYPYYDNHMQRNVYYLPSLGSIKLIPDKNLRKRAILTPELKENLEQRRIHYIHILSRKKKGNKSGAGNTYIRDSDIIRVTGDLYYYKWKERGNR
jgi:hypothetical protein